MHGLLSAYGPLLMLHLTRSVRSRHTPKNTLTYFPPSEYVCQRFPPEPLYPSTIGGLYSQPVSPVLSSLRPASSRPPHAAALLVAVVPLVRGRGSVRLGVYTCGLVQ